MTIEQGKTFSNYIYRIEANIDLDKKKSIERKRRRIEQLH